MTELLEMARVRTLLGMEGRETRLLVRRLRAIAEERKSPFPLTRLAGRWVTTRTALEELIPELAGGTPDDDLRALVRRQACELEALRVRVEALETHPRAQRRP